MKEALFTQTSCVILSAGSSSRMATHKALLKFDNKKTFIQEITATYLLSGIEQVIVVVNCELLKLINEGNCILSEKVKLIVNEEPELGRFYSLQTGVKHMIPGNSSFFQNIDNPFTAKTLLRELILRKNEADVIIPAFQNESGHPVLINPSVIEQIIKVQDPDLRIDHFLKRFEIKKIEISDPYILVNINSPEDLAKLI